MNNMHVHIYITRMYIFSYIYSHMCTEHIYLCKYVCVKCMYLVLSAL